VAERKVGLNELLRFFIPLGITSSLMMFTHSIISAGLSRTVSPVVSTAAHAVAVSLSDMAGGPLCQIRQTAMVLISSRQSFQTVRRVYVITMACFVAIMLAIAYVPLAGSFVLQGLLGVKDELFPATLTAFRVTMFLPLLSGLRFLYHGVITSRRETRYISIGMMFRVAFMVILIFSFVRWRFVVGPLVGSLTLVSGVGLECLLSYLFGRKLIPDGEQTVSDREVWRFYLPLIASALVFSMGKPFINAGLARMPDAAVSLAAFSVASSLAWVIVCPSQTTHMLTLVFGREQENRPLVRRFATVLAIGSTGLLAVLAYTPIGAWVLTNLVGVPAETLAATLLAVRTLSAFPLIICWQEYSMGMLLLSHSTRLVSIGKALNLGSTIAFVLFVAPSLPGPIAAPLAQMVGFTCEGAMLYGSRMVLRRNLENQLRLSA
jgi:hypothetical protein